jgi:hypothetical protein
VVQREKFLFYRGVGTFPPPVVAKALGGERVRVVNNSGGVAKGAVLLTVRVGKIGFRPLGELAAGADVTAALPPWTRSGRSGRLPSEGADRRRPVREGSEGDGEHVVGRVVLRGGLAGAVPRAAGEDGRVAADHHHPKPAEVVRVLVGRHDFLTPEQEAVAEAQLKRARAAQAELSAANAELKKLGRFRAQAEGIAAQRLDAKPAAATPR